MGKHARGTERDKGMDCLLTGGGEIMVILSGNDGQEVEKGKVCINDSAAALCMEKLQCTTIRNNKSVKQNQL